MRNKAETDEYFSAIMGGISKENLSTGLIFRGAQG